MVIEPIVMTLAPAPAPMFIVLPPVEFARLIVWAPVPPNRVAVPVPAPVDPRVIVPVVIAAPIDTEPANWALAN